MDRRYELTDQEFARIADLLPPDGRRGGQWNDHRTTLDGIFWVLHTGAQWREVPDRYGKWKTVYDRSALIERSVANLREKLIEESIIVSLVVIVFLFHFRSSFVAVLTLPLAVLLALLAMRGIGLTSNIMRLGVTAIAIGAMIDASIIMIENAHKHVEHEEAKPEG